MSLQPLTVSLEVSGLSEDGTFFKFDHNFYNHKGENIAFCEMLGAWIDLKVRKMTHLPKVLMDLADDFPKSEGYKILTKEDTRANGRAPKNLNI